MVAHGLRSCHVRVAFHIYLRRRLRRRPARSASTARWTGGRVQQSGRDRCVLDGFWRMSVQVEALG